MPQYTFSCAACKAEFRRSLKMGEHATHVCPECGDDAARVFDGFGFAFATGRGQPGNSGVAKHDYPTADHVVGTTAEPRWQVIKEREALKEQVRAEAGSRPLVRRAGPGFVEYEAGDANLVGRRKQIVADMQQVAEKDGKQ